MIKGGYLITSDSSRVKATTEIHDYSNIVNNKLNITEETGSYMPYRQPGESESDFTNPDDANLMDVDVCWATKNNFTYFITSDYSKDKLLADYLIFQEPQPMKNNSFQGGWKSIVDAARTMTPYAKIYFNKATDPNLETLYISWKITGLPSDVFYNAEYPRLESITKDKIKVTGSQEAVKLLSP